MKNYIFDNFKEIYSPTDNINTYYIIDEYGNIYSKFSNKFLSQIITENGYKAVSLNTVDGKRIQRRIHRLVMLTFCYFDGCENLEVNHKDGNKFNNHISNLEWVTSKQNINHAIKYGLRNSWIGENNPLSKITKNEAIAISNMVIQGYNNEQILNIIPSANNSIITQIILGKTWNNIIDENTVKIMREVRYPEILSLEDKHNICQYYQDIKSPIIYYGSIKYYIENCLLNLNIPLNESTFRMAKRLLYKYQDPEITSQYNY